MNLKRWGSMLLFFLVAVLPVPVAAQVGMSPTERLRGGVEISAVDEPAAPGATAEHTEALLQNRLLFSPAAEQTLEAEMSRSKKYALIGAAVGAIAGGVVFHTTLADRWEPSGDGYVPPISWAYGAFALAGGALGALVGYAVAPQ